MWTDSSGHVTSKNYWFTTAPVYANKAPTHTDPLLVSANGGNTNIEAFSCYNQTTIDSEGSSVTNIYNWLKVAVRVLRLQVLFFPSTLNQILKICTAD